MNPMTEHVALAWLNGWHRISGRSVLMGTGVYCVGCGKGQGTMCVTFPEGYRPPENEPDWPFPQETCPVCGAGIREEFDSWPPRTVELYQRLKACEAIIARMNAAEPETAI